MPGLAFADIVQQASRKRPARIYASFITCDFARVRQSLGQTTGHSTHRAAMTQAFRMRALRDQGPTYPIYIVPEFAEIHLYEYVGLDDEAVISVAPHELPAGFLDRRN